MWKKYGVAAGIISIVAALAFFTWRQIRPATGKTPGTPATGWQGDSIQPAELPLAAIPVARAVTVADYFRFMDDLVLQYDSLAPYALSEHLIVRANPWLIDTLENTDYYRQMARGNFVENQRAMTVLKPGDTLWLPGEKTAASLQTALNNTYLDINIPAFQLHIVEGDSVLYKFPVRVGKNQRKFLAMASRVVDLRTQTGAGEIVRINRYPVFYDPVTGREFKYTKRDDHRTTLMPQIPWLEPALDGRRLGQMIHPTTNPVSLGKPASNGCIGTREADAWRIYYAAPVGTKVVVRYDLEEITARGDTLRWNDIYQYAKRGKRKNTYAALLPLIFPAPNTCWCYP